MKINLNQMEKKKHNEKEGNLLSFCVLFTLNACSELPTCFP